MKKYLLVVLGAMVLAACGNDTDKIGRASTVFHMLGKNDRIEVEGFDDPDVQGGCLLYFVREKRRFERNGQSGRRCQRRIGFLRTKCGSHPL